MHFFLSKEEIKAIIESLLFVSEKPISVKILATLINITEEQVRQLADELMVDYQKRKSGLVIFKYDDSYQMLTNPIYGRWIKLFKNLNSNSKISEQALETLAIIAYKQPITKAEIDKIRGVNSDYAIKSLVDKKLIKIVGKKEVPGRPFLYGTTKEFLKLFGISSLKDLPNLNEFKLDAA